MPRRGPFPGKGHGFSFGAGFLYRVAERAYQRCNDVTATPTENTQTDDPILGKNILDPTNWASWTPLIQTGGIAKWACNVARDMVAAALDAGDVPLRDWLSMMEMPFRLDDADQTG